MLYVLRCPEVKLAQIKSVPALVMQCLIFMNVVTGKNHLQSNSAMNNTPIFDKSFFAWKITFLKSEQISSAPSEKDMNNIVQCGLAQNLKSVQIQIVSWTSFKYFLYITFFKKGTTFEHILHFPAGYVSCKEHTNVWLTALI